MGTLKDLTGIIYGQLKAISVSHTTKSGAFWNVKCIDCGNLKIVRGRSLSVGDTKACGCRGSWLKGKSKKQAGETGLRTFYGQTKRSAKKRGLFFDLTIEQLKKISILNCHYCNAKPNAKSNVNNTKCSDEIKKFSTFIHHGIDRVDNSKGYILENIVSCCFKCNFAKLDSSIEEHQKWIDQLVDHQIHLRQLKAQTSASTSENQIPIKENNPSKSDTCE